VLKIVFAATGTAAEECDATMLLYPLQLVSLYITGQWLMLINNETDLVLPYIRSRLFAKQKKV